MPEKFGMKIFLELAVKNLKDIEKKIKARLKKINLKGVEGGDGVSNKVKKASEFSGTITDKLGNIIKTSNEKTFNKLSKGLEIVNKTIIDADTGEKKMISKAAEKQEKTLVGIKGKLGGIIAVLLLMKPTQDFLKIIKNFVVLGFLSLEKLRKGLIGGLGDLTKSIGEEIVALKDKLLPKLIELKDTLSEKLANLRDKLVPKLAELKDKTSEKLESLKDRIVNKLVELKNKTVEKLSNLKNKFVELKDKFVEKFIELKDKFVEKIIELKDKFVEKVVELKEKFSERFVELKEKLKDLLTNLKDKLREKLELIRLKIVDLVSGIKGLPAKIWEKIKQLGTTIVNAIKKIRIFNKSDGVDDSVNDALITKDGKVIKLNPNDNILATQGDPGAGTGSGKTVNNFFYGVTPNEMMDFIKRELKNDINLSGRY